MAYGQAIPQQHLTVESYFAEMIVYLLMARAGSQTCVAPDSKRSDGYTRVFVQQRTQTVA